MSDEKSKKIKDVIKVLSDLLDSKEPEADTNSATLASDLPGPSTPTQPSDHFALDITPTDLRSELCAAFPPLLNAGGFELLHCLPNTKDLSLIPITRPSRPIANLQQNTGKGRIYIRPIQEDLITAKDSEDCLLYTSDAADE